MRLASAAASALVGSWAQQNSLSAMGGMPHGWLSARVAVHSLRVTSPWSANL